MYIGNVEITKREVIFSSIIILIVLALNYKLAELIEQKTVESNQEYYKAVQIYDNVTEFAYALDTDIGNTLAYGKLEALEPVSFEELTGDYYIVEKRTQVYTMHTRTVSRTINGKTTTHIETYYSWDPYRTETIQTDTFTFLEKTFESSIISVDPEIEIPLNENTVNTKYVSWISGDYIYKDGDRFASVGDLRYYFNALPVSYNATIFSVIQDHRPTNTSTYVYMVPSAVLSEKNRLVDLRILGMRIALCIGTILILIGFVRYDNYWLEN